MGLFIWVYELECELMGLRLEHEDDPLERGLKQVFICDSFAPKVLSWHWYHWHHHIFYGIWAITPEALSPPPSPPPPKPPHLAHHPQTAKPTSS
ncbi:hypothetical protein CYMTET_29961 [Cymbomonas tetramitiformis]|uniref:Uncharacterized protein n=1 Tax=Cymbomonas tetramitiformis TaxID=36881 RepID=A0AAE0FK11_9CHLO|nr:hypothetical protein CYMTET_29961 [Cymbomonas tetramitiformis]